MAHHQNLISLILIKQTNNMEKKFKGTPGKWDYESGSRLIFHPTQKNDILVKVVNTWTGEGLDIEQNNEWEHNAQLISIAPDMLDGLIKCREHLHTNVPSTPETLLLLS